MALLTGIFEPLINSIKSFDLTAVKLITSGNYKEFSEHVNLTFLIPVGCGIILSILSVARLLEYLFDHHAILIWAFFFGLILASVYFVGKRIKNINSSIISLFILGTAMATTIAFMEPATENASFPYLLLCGVIAMCSMILPGLSGSYILLLMGNYQLIMIEAITGLRIDILLPVAIGAAGGLFIFARILSWIFKRFHDQTIALLTGFIFGSLAVLWPWKTAILKVFELDGVVKEKVIGYSYNLPEFTASTLVTTGVMIIGIVSIIAVETMAARKS